MLDVDSLRVKRAPGQATVLVVVTPDGEEIHCFDDPTVPAKPLVRDQVEDFIDMTLAYYQRLPKTSRPQ